MFLSFNIEFATSHSAISTAATAGGVSGGVIVAVIIITLCITLYCVLVYYKRKDPHSHIRQIEMTIFKNPDLRCIDKTITTMNLKVENLKVENRICK